MRDFCGVVSCPERPVVFCGVPSALLPRDFTGVDDTELRPAANFTGVNVAEFSPCLCTSWRLR